MQLGSFLVSTVIVLMPIIVQAQRGTKERIQVHSRALEGNLIGDSPDREVTIYLPPSYGTEPNRRYPVLYMLHGFTDTDSQWFGWEEHWINLHEVIDESLTDEQTREMIVVMPNAYNRFKGSMYSSSVTIGDWETFIAQELVTYIDSNYRTIRDVRSRGLAGHSMGGYGTIRLGMKFPNIWTAIYMLSPCCMEGTVRTNPEYIHSVESIATIDQLENASFGIMTLLASASAWAPNPKNPPFYLDLPFSNGKVQHDIASKFAANRTLYTIEQYIPNLKKLNAIAMDVGLQDFGISKSTEKLHKLLDTYSIQHEYESYEGDHINRIAERIKTKTLPFFSKYLEFE